MGALVAINADNTFKKVSCNRTVGNTSCVNSIQKHIYQSHLGGHNHQRGTSVYGFCAVVEGSWLVNLNDLQLQLLYLHARICRACQGERQAAVDCSGTPSPGAVLCCVENEAVIDSTGNSIFIKTCISTVWYGVSRGVCTN